MRYRLRTLLVVLALGPPWLVGLYVLSMGPAHWLVDHGLLSRTCISRCMARCSMRRTAIGPTAMADSTGYSTGTCRFGETRLVYDALPNQGLRHAPFHHP
jgi:hypothetical protein